MRAMTRIALIALLAAAVVLPASASASTWSTGTYRGRLLVPERHEQRGTVTFDVSRSRARITHLRLVLRCMEGDKRTFTIDDAGSGLRETQPEIANLVGTAADRVSEAATYLRDHNASEALDHVQQLARRQPALVVGGGLALGLVLGRLLRTGTAVAQSDMRAVGPYTGATRGAYGSGSYGAGGYRSGGYGAGGYGTSEYGGTGYGAGIADAGATYESTSPAGDLAATDAAADDVTAVEITSVEVIPDETASQTTRTKRGAR